jgi:hypothetical protein
MEIKGLGGSVPNGKWLRAKRSALFSTEKTVQHDRSKK